MIELGEPGLLPLFPFERSGLGNPVLKFEDATGGTEKRFVGAELSPAAPEPCADMAAVDCDGI